MNLQVNENITVFLEAASRFFGEKKIFIQWKLMTKDQNGSWVLDTANPNSIVGLVAQDAAYDSFIAMSDNDKTTAYTTFLQTQYPN